MKFFNLILGVIILSCFSLVNAQEAAFKYDSKNKRDPFMPLVTPDGYLVNIEPLSEIGDIKLEGIMHDPQGASLVIINGKVMRVGDKIGDFEILEINSSAVSFLKENQKIIIELKKEE